MTEIKKRAKEERCRGNKSEFILVYKLQGWEPILIKTMFDSDSDTACFFYVR